MKRIINNQLKKQGVNIKVKRNQIQEQDPQCPMGLEEQNQGSLG